MRHITFRLTFLLTIMVTQSSLFSTTKENDLVSFLDQQLVGIFKFYAKQIINSNTNLVNKRILLNYLLIRLMRERQRMIDEMKETSNGYMHWRMG